MGISEKAHEMTEKTTGKVKEVVGDATDNARLESEGLEQQTVADLDHESLESPEEEAEAALRERQEYVDPDAIRRGA